jgi:prepilin-type N-terminal cleavage/methylation domain-containing protein
MRMSKTKGFTLIELMIVIAIIAILAAILIPNFVKARAQAQHTACCTNVKHLGIACEMYSIENGKITEDAIIGAVKGGIAWNCPSAGSDTYNLATHTNPDRYTVYCKGLNHQDLGVSEDYPQFAESRGLLSKNTSE